MKYRFEKMFYSINNISIGIIVDTLDHRYDIKTYQERNSPLYYGTVYHNISRRNVVTIHLMLLFIKLRFQLYRTVHDVYNNSNDLISSTNL